MLISRTPFRISFLGGGTDYPSWYQHHGGTVLATTIDKFCYWMCRELQLFRDTRFRVIHSRIENCQAIAQIQHPAVQAVLQSFSFQRGLETICTVDLPSRSGLGSSSALIVGLLHGLHHLQGRRPSPAQLAQESLHIEQHVLQETVGSQDQVCAAYGGVNHISFAPNGEITVQPVLISRDRRHQLNQHLMLFYTKVQRTATASDIASSYVQDLTQKHRQLQMMQDLVQDGIKILVGQRDLNDFGELLHEAWQIKRGLGTKISNPRIDELYCRARAAGAVGGKLTGAGGGGFLLLFVPPERQSVVQEQLSDLISVPFQFESAGSQIILREEQSSGDELAKLRTHSAIAPPSKFVHAFPTPRDLNIEGGSNS